MIYDITNPSDPYTIIAEDLKVAAVACLLLGQGQYGLSAARREWRTRPHFYIRRLLILWYPRRNRFLRNEATDGTTLNALLHLVVK